jgi:aspartate carbamoyltransferase catalytic subunit
VNSLSVEGFIISTVHSSRDFSIAVFGVQKQMEACILSARIYHSDVMSFTMFKKKLQTLAPKNLKSKSESSRTVTLCLHFPVLFLLLLSLVLIV